MDTTELTTSASEASQVVGAQRTHDLTPDLVRQMGQRESFLCLLLKNSLFATPSLSGCGSLKVVVVFVSVLGAPLPPRPADAAKQCEESFEGALKRPPHHHACRLPRASPAPASDQARVSFALSAFRFLDREDHMLFEGRKLLQHGFSTQNPTIQPQQSKIDRNKRLGERFSGKKTGEQIRSSTGWAGG